MNMDVDVVEPTSDLVEKRKRPEAVDLVEKRNRPVAVWDEESLKEEFIRWEKEQDEHLAELGKKRMANDNKFKAVTDDGEYMKLHWHMEEKEKVDPGEVYFCFGFHPRIWDLQHYGDTYGDPPNTLQVYKIKLTCNSSKDVYPLKVYGSMVLFSTHNVAQPIFLRSDRENSQTITEKDPNLLLTGPVTPPWYKHCDTLCCIHAELRLKGTTPSDDKYLSLRHDVGVNYDNELLCPDDISNSECCRVLGIGNHYLLELTHGIVTYSVWADISVEFVCSSNPQDQSRKEYYFTAYIGDKMPPMEEIVLLDSRVGDDVLEGNKFKLSRRTICVGLEQRLMVHIEQDKISKELIFHPCMVGEEKEEVDISSFMIQVKVEWSTYWKSFL